MRVTDERAEYIRHHGHTGEDIRNLLADRADDHKQIEELEELAKGAARAGVLSAKALEYRIAELEAALAEQTKEIERLRGIIGNLVNAINELGNTLFGKPTYANPRSWRDAKAEWWQRCVKAVDAAEAAKEASDAS